MSVSETTPMSLPDRSSTGAPEISFSASTFASSRTVRSSRTVSTRGFMRSAAVISLMARVSSFPSDAHKPTA